MTLRDGGSFRADGAGQCGVHLAPYFELDQPWPLAAAPSGCAHGVPCYNASTATPHGGQ